ncbi:MAG: hypothetical protein R3B54_09885 [Bdellovibrionota bacterium]
MRLGAKNFSRLLLGFCIVFAPLRNAAADDHQKGESVRVEVLKCELIFARDAAELRAVIYKPRSVDMRMKSIISMSDQPLEIESVVNDTALMDVWLAFYPKADGVRVRWWSGIGDEFIEFPAQFESGDWAKLENGEPAVLLAPEDVLRRIDHSGPNPTPMDVAKFLVMDGLVEFEEQSGAQIRMRRDEPFRPRFVFNDGLVSVEGMISTTEVTVYVPNPE